MAAESLPKILEEADERFLAETDKLGMGAEGAAWIYDYELGDWRYYLITSLLDVIGSEKVYLNLLKAFPAMNMPGEMTIFDIHLGSPKDSLFRFFAEWLRVKDGAKVIFEGNEINGVMMRGVIYRMIPARPEEEVRHTAKVFVRNVRKLVSA